MPHNSLHKIQLKINNGELDEAIEILTQIIALDKTHDKALFMRGTAFKAKNEFGNAMNDFIEVLEINPQNKEAQTNITMIQNILNFYHKDRYNP